ncbi:hypothetical protein [uncultured Psychroserpens sp.]|uniref:hypothetical protein n=1 Tax=uncultured Psychroserpens sp. TaxID=255436 RepID=UPI00262BB658|nr:hypothetical protein [uncultured Psychroserpens sp.]
MNTLKLFNAVLAKTSNDKPYISDEGYIIAPNALWAKDRIMAFLKAEKLSGNDLNKTFHKSWLKIRNSSRYELYMEQIKHYLSTYGSNFRDDIYIPEEILSIPNVKLSYKIINAYSIDEMTQKCLNILASGMALKEDTVDALITILVDELGYTFTGKEHIRNKEAVVKLAEYYDIYPSNPVEFFRYIIYRATDTTLLIKNDALIELIKDSSYNPAQAFNTFGLEKLAEIFNRFKPLFLAFKSKAPKTINKISKLSKTYHKPLISNPLNDVTNALITDNDIHWLDNATPFALFKALSACYTRNQGQDAFLYRIRNGKSWVKSNTVSTVVRKNMLVNLLKKNKAAKYKGVVPENTVFKQNYAFLLKYLKQRFDLSGKRLFFPEDITYALPTSEKMYVGNIPTGTRFYGKKLAVGIYWEDAWGARDLDLSGLNIAGKVGWNAAYNQQQGNLMYSGDITSAPNGAVEYLYANKGLNVPTLIQNNVFSGAADCGYKIIVGKGDSVSKDYMMNPNKLFADIRCESVQKQTILGILIPKKDKQCFVLLNFGAGHTRVSGNSEVSNLATKALYQQWNESLSFDSLVRALGAQITDYKDEADFDFSLENLEKDSFLKLFN